ncbi:hypothetical protein SPRG_11689 [Saprolegnia parasitica CBS 223.65]|uniref:Uncharacterized protein n=1 Tax=Saprolegnia parasitica (strain CBS 223.65) TaxID=695850 RepID=A0A067C065_SAPPC|nr:hypothetical protein SPRG_11689 [Saprolegnia parasitica CBS 223.65]KDO22505.1 hypothetical protein SPRG_11689 [Saprolegnia parasitica CBS 223.65]|eukprot:XP_012206753.1 hypothetical protein SPRG_11689 [Saprolegnia parasitica CBS 223.65]
MSNRSSAAAEAISFLHDLHRMWGAGSMDFAPEDPAYVAFLRHVAMVCFSIGLVAFALLLLIVARRIFLAAPARFRRRAHHEASFDVMAVVLLGITALSALSGLLAEAQVDYSVHKIAHSMKNVSHTFHEIQAVTQGVEYSASGVRATVDDMIVAFNSSLPHDANDLAIEALRMDHAGQALLEHGRALPSNLSSMAFNWEAEYFWIKSSTNGIILTMALSCFLAIAAIGWSMSGSLRFAIFLVLVIIPSSHALFGVYLSNSIEAADYCIAPSHNTLRLFRNDSGVAYFVECPSNATLYAPSWARMNASHDHALALEATLADYAKTLPTMDREKLQSMYLDPIHEQLKALSTLRARFATVSACTSTKALHTDVVDSWCTYGVLGLLSLWLHQVVLCVLLFISAVALVAVYENVRAKEDRLEMQYHLLSSYEDENHVEHLYMTPE